jgi:flagellar hook-associated protein 1 FlgK
VSGTFSSLNGALSALRYNQVAMDVASNNVSNAGTPGYARRQVVGQTLGAPATPAIWSRWNGAQGGVEPGPVTRMVDPLLDARSRTEHAASAYLGARATSLGRFENALGEPGDNGVAAALAAFQQGWHDAANNPGDEAARTQLLARANTLAAALNTQSRAVDTERDDQQTRLAALGNEVNQTAGELAALNAGLRSANLAGTDAGTLLDRRDQLALRLSELTGAKVTINADTTVDVSLGGQPLVQGKTPFTLTVSGATLTLGGSDLTLTGGEMGGIQQVLVTDLPAYKAGLDAVAKTLVTEVNKQHALGMDLDGIRGEPIFVPTGTSALTIKVELIDPRRIAAADIALKDPTVPGSGLRDNKIANTLATMEIGGSDYRKLITGFGVTVAASRQIAANQDVLTAQVDAARESVSGINVDEEMVNLLTAQRGYEAASRVLTTLDSVLDTLINRTGLVR